MQFSTKLKYTEDHSSLLVEGDTGAAGSLNLLKVNRVGLSILICLLLENRHNGMKRFIWQKPLKRPVIYIGR